MSSVRNPAILVVGADGAIGEALADAWRGAGARVSETTRRPAAGAEKLALDLARSVGEIALPRVDVAYLLAAVTDLALCERDPDGTGRVNATHTIELARRLAAQGAHVVFPSTNLVFDGETAHRHARERPAPSCEYGRQKARVEAALAALGASAAVLRLTKVVGPKTGPFVSWVEKLRRGETIEAFSDKVCAPVTLTETVALCLGIGRERLSGVFQASAARDMTYVEAARVLARRAGAEPGQVKAVSGAERGVAAVLLPAHTTLDASGLHEALGWRAPEPEAALFAGLGL